VGAALHLADLPHAESNAVIFTDATRTLAIAGQMSRVDAVNVALMKARAVTEVLMKSVAASDARSFVP
jgi:AICAR transformylase/IMP cyclohydrolase PurH